MSYGDWLWNAFVMVGPMCAAWTLHSGEIETTQMVHTFLHVNKIFQCNSFFSFMFPNVFVFTKEYSPEKSCSTSQDPHSSHPRRHLNATEKGRGKKMERQDMRWSWWESFSILEKLKKKKKAKQFQQEPNTGRAVWPLVLMSTWQGHLQFWLNVCLCNN